MNCSKYQALETGKAVVTPLVIVSTKIKMAKHLELIVAEKCVRTIKTTEYSFLFSNERTNSERTG